ELRDLARAGRLGPADLVQPPNASEWVYASEIPELKQVLGSGGSADDDDDLEFRPRGNSALQPILAAVLVLIIAGGGFFAWQFSQQMPDVNKRLIGEGGLSYSEMVVTAGGQALLSEPDAEAKPMASADKDSVLELLAKRGDYYQARAKEG